MGPADPQPVQTSTEQAPDNGEQWRAADVPDALPADPVLVSWLTNRGSLTHRLQARGQDRFALEVVDEGHETATPCDSALLGTGDRQFYARRVRLGVRGELLVHACTLVPEQTLAAHPWLSELGNRPLGDALADREDVERTPFEYAWIRSGRPPLSAALRQLDIRPPGLWGRRSRFLVAGEPILVYEFFLPGLATFGPA